MVNERCTYDCMNGTLSYRVVAARKQLYVTDSIEIWQGLLTKNSLMVSRTGLAF